MARGNGYTIIEIMIVIVVLATLAAIVVPQMGGAQNTSTIAALKRQFQFIDSQVELYRTQNGERFPTQDPDDPLSEGGANSGWGVMVSEGYLPEEPLNPFNMRSLLVEGTSDDAKDLGREVPEGWFFQVVGDNERLDFFAAGYDAATDSLSTD
ncbi:MAG: prepilin-type N-terminal cleavage/methylation domain-containing protein [Planctomycetota bacterium]